MARRAGLVAVAVMCVAPAVAFAPRARAAAAGLATRRATSDDEPLPPSSDVDWDAELRKLNAGELAGRAKANELALEVERTGRVTKRKVVDATRSVKASLPAAPRAPKLSGDATFWFAVIAGLALFPVLVDALNSAGSGFDGGGGAYV